MPRGFFHQSTIKSTKKTDNTAPKCGVCGLYKNCVSPKMAETGDGRLKTLIVAEAPGEQEDRRGIQLIGPAGQLLRDNLEEIGVDLDRDCWKTNTLICRPPKNRTPTKEEIDACRPNLLNVIGKYRPERIIPLGGIAITSILGTIWKRDIGPTSRWVGFKIPCQTYNTWICPTYHPSYIRREDKKVLKLWFKRHLQEAFELEGKPWSTIPNYESQVECLYKPKDITEAIHYMRDFPGVAAFDYETNMLKPDSNDSQIVCCSIAWGVGEATRCISFPLSHTSVYTALSEFLKSPIGKIASNMKFEDRWTRKIFGHRVRNWRWDTMQAAHVLDNRPWITSVKFQALVLLGFPTYDSLVEEFLQGGATTTNKILEEVRMDQLLLYCGLDSLVELEVAIRQSQVLGVSLC